MMVKVLFVGGELDGERRETDVKRIRQGYTWGPNGNVYRFHAFRTVGENSASNSQMIVALCEDVGLDTVFEAFARCYQETRLSRVTQVDPPEVY